MSLGPAKLMCFSAIGIINALDLLQEQDRGYVLGWRQAHVQHVSSPFIKRRREEDKNGSSKALQCQGQGQQQWIRIGLTGSGISAGPAG